MKEVGPYVLDDGWAMEQKLDGHRVMLVAGEPITPITRGGNLYGKPIPSLAGLRLPGGVVLDCELVEGAFWAFDILLEDGSIDHLPLSTRRGLLKPEHIAPVRVIPQATGSAKEDTLLRVATSGGEGVVFKRLSSPYRRGERSPDWLKVKFTSTADLIVLATRDDGRESAKLGLFADGSIVEVGRCSLLGKPQVFPGDVVEVRYLYASEGLRLVQPTLVRIRPDKNPSECDITQLRFTRKTVIEEFA